VYLTGVLASKIILVKSGLWLKKFQQTWSVSAVWAVIETQIYTRLDSMEVWKYTNCTHKRSSTLVMFARRQDIWNSVRPLQFWAVFLSPTSSSPPLPPQTPGHKSVTKFICNRTPWVNIHSQKQIIFYFH